MTMFVCVRGCCGGCENCYGYAIGCHRDPCRCDVPCTCQDFEGEYVGPCERHWPTPAPKEADRE